MGQAAQMTVIYAILWNHCISLHIIASLSMLTKSNQSSVQNLIQVGSRATTIERLPLSDGRTYQVSGLQRVRSTSN